MPDLPLPRPAFGSAVANSTSKTSDSVRSAILGGVSDLNDQTDLTTDESVPSDTTTPSDSPIQLDENGELEPLTPPPPASSLNSGVVKSTGFIAQPPPAAVTALSSVSGNKPPILDEPKEPESSKASTEPVRASAFLPNLPPPPTSPVASTPPPPSIKSPQTTVQANKQSSQPKFAKTTSPLMKWLPLLAGGILLFIVIVLIVSKIIGGGSGNSASTAKPHIPGSQNGESMGTGDQSSSGQENNSANPPGQNNTAQNVTLEYWGLWELESNMAEAIKAFEVLNPGIKIQYIKQSHKDYRERLQTALNSGSGPDVFRFHASWTPMMFSELAPVPSTVITAADFKSAYYPAASVQLQQDGQIMGIPLMYDGLMLYYNTDVFVAAGEKPPATWAELRVLAGKLTLKQGNELKRAGVALGNASNVDHFADVLGLLMLQNGANLMYPNSAEGRDALLFYTNFVTKDAVWNEFMPSSTVAFARGDAAMMFAPSWRAHEIAALNPDLKFATAPLPQLSNSRVTWATYWAEGVNNKSLQKEAAWKFLAYLSSKEGSQKLYATQAQSRSFGEPYARLELADGLANHPVLSSLMQDAPYAKGWHMSSFTHDNGLNDLIIKYYADAINKVVAGGSAQAVLEDLQTGVTQVLNQYKVPRPL